MTLSKQLYIIISFIFFMIFAGNFIISVTNFKDYLEIESKSKSQDTATSLGMTLKALISDKTDPEITSTVRAIANRGFYKEIRLEDVQFDFTKDDLLKDSDYKIKDIKINAQDGEIISSQEDNALESELAELEGIDDSISEDNNITYSFVPSVSFPNNSKLNISFIAYNDTTSKTMESKIVINNILVQVQREEKFEAVPQWFIDMLPMNMIETKSEISNGWKTQAVIYVSANAGEAYLKLYEQVQGAIYYALVSFTISILILIVFLRFILQPLKDIEKLATNISQGTFETIEKLPWTLELKTVSISMNDMSNKIKNMINKLNSNLEKITEQLSQDELTGLEQEETFQTDMKQMFIKRQDGYIFSVKIDKFSDFASNNSYSTVDEFLKDFANALRKSDKDILAYRFFGSTFAMISKNSSHEENIKITQNLQRELEDLSKKYGLSSVGHIGVTPFNPISTTDDIMDFANSAYEKAVVEGNNGYFIRDKDDLAKDMLVWKDLVSGIIHNSTFNIAYTYQALSMDGNKTILHDETFTSATTSEGKTIPIGTFISVAEQYDLIIDFDKAVINKVIQHIREDDIKYEILVNLAFDSILNNNFKQWLQDTLLTHKDIAHQLVFSMTAYGCNRDIEKFKEFIKFIHQYNAKIILKRFETKFIALDTLKELHLDYIRLAKSYTNDIISDSAKQNFVESTTELAKLLNIKVFAENVKNDDEFDRLKELGIFGAGIKDILKYEGILTQGIITHCMKDIETNIVNIGIMGKIATISVELLQNMMHYSKDEMLGNREIVPAGYIEINKDKNYVYYITTNNIISIEDKAKIEPTLVEISNLDTAGIRKRYRELRKTGENTHNKGGGIGFYEIAKATTGLEYEFIAINEEKYQFIFKLSVESKKKKDN